MIQLIALIVVNYRIKFYDLGCKVEWLATLVISSYVDWSSSSDWSRSKRFVPFLYPNLGSISNVAIANSYQRYIFCIVARIYSVSVRSVWSVIREVSCSLQRYSKGRMASRPLKVNELTWLHRWFVCQSSSNLFFRHSYIPLNFIKMKKAFGEFICQQF